jgi:hypothetical protein
MGAQVYRLYRPFSLASVQIAPQALFGTPGPFLCEIANTGIMITIQQIADELPLDLIGVRLRDIDDDGQKYVVLTS